MEVGISSLALFIFVAIVLYKGIKVVPQSNIWVIERLGKFHKTLEGGFHLIIPVVDSIRVRLTKQEQMIDIPSQSVITKDNVNISVDGLVFVQVQNAQDATYGVTNFKLAIANLATTTLRAEIGQLNLDETLSSRDQLNARILSALDEASMKWGVKSMRVEIRDISVPLEIEQAMNMQMKAEREKRAIELRALAEKEAVIRDAEAQKQKEVLAAEALERMADAKKYEQNALTDAKKYEQEQTAKAQENAMNMINDAMAKNPQAAEFLLTKDRISAFDALAKNGSNDKIVVPYEATELVGSLSIIKDVLSSKGHASAAN